MVTDELHVRVLGPFKVRRDRVNVGPAASRRRAILAILANSVVSSQTLVDLVWGDRPPSSSRNLIQTYVSTWRKTLGGSASAPAAR